MQIAPSLLAADFAHLGDEISWIDDSVADWLHFDVMDGVFVPNISFGFPVMESLVPLCTKPIDVHLMIIEPWKYTTRIADLGARLMTVHYEACENRLKETLSEIRASGMLVGISISPDTSTEVLRPVASMVDVILIMSVHPGFGGQKFIEGTYDKIRACHLLIEETGSHAQIEVDGGVNFQNAALLRKAGADILVAGSTVFRAPDPSVACLLLKEA